MSRGIATAGQNELDTVDLSHQQLFCVAYCPVDF